MTEILQNDDDLINAATEFDAARAEESTAMAQILEGGEYDWAYDGDSGRL